MTRVNIDHKRYRQAFSDLREKYEEAYEIVAVAFDTFLREVFEAIPELLAIKIEHHHTLPPSLVASQRAEAWPEWVITGYIDVVQATYTGEDYTYEVRHNDLLPDTVDLSSRLNEFAPMFPLLLKSAGTHDVYYIHRSQVWPTDDAYEGDTEGHPASPDDPQDNPQRPGR